MSSSDHHFDFAMHFLSNQHGQLAHVTVPWCPTLLLPWPVLVNVHRLFHTLCPDASPTALAVAIVPFIAAQTMD